jgi:hypothetical protein
MHLRCITFGACIIVSPLLCSDPLIHNKNPLFILRFRCSDDALQPTAVERLGFKN